MSSMYVRASRRARPRYPRVALFEQVRAHEAVEVALEHAVGVAHLVVGAVVLDHRVGVQHVGADLRAEVHVLRLAALARDLLQALALLALDELGAQHLHRGLAVLRLRALVLALHDDPARPVRDAHRGVGLVDVLAARAGRAVRVDLQVVGLDLDLARVLDDRRDLDARERRLATVGGVERRQAHEPVHALLGAVEAVGVLALDAERRRLDARLLPRAGLEQLGLEAALARPISSASAGPSRPSPGRRCRRRPR